MSTWNETHYARAQAFTGLLAAALAAATPAQPPVAPPPAPPPTGGATAANVFKKIPWKK